MKNTKSNSWQSSGYGKKNAETDFKQKRRVKGQMKDRANKWKYYLFQPPASFFKYLWEEEASSFVAIWNSVPSVLRLQ